MEFHFGVSKMIVLYRFYFIQIFNNENIFLFVFFLINYLYVIFMVFLLLGRLIYLIALSNIPSKIIFFIEELIFNISDGFRHHKMLPIH